MLPNSFLPQMQSGHAAAPVAIIGGLGRLVKATPASRDLYVAGITRGGTPTYAASSLKFKLGIRW